MQVVVQRLFHEVIHEGANRRSFWPHVLRTELSLGLRFEYRFFYLNTHGSADRGADIDSVEVFFIKIFNRLSQ